MYGFTQGNCFQQAQPTQWSTPPQRFQTAATQNAAGYGFVNAGQSPVGMYVGSGSCTAAVGGSNDHPSLAHRGGFSASVMPGPSPVQGPLPAKGSSQRVRSPLMPGMAAKELEGARSPNIPPHIQGFSQNYPAPSDWNLHNSSALHTGPMRSARPTVRELSPRMPALDQRPAALRIRRDSINMPSLPPPMAFTPAVPQAACVSLQGQQPLLVPHLSSQATNVLQTSQSLQVAAMTAAAATAAASQPPKITIVSARGLRDADWLPGAGKSDPYCICEIIGKNATKIQTKVINNTCDPVWEHQAEMVGFSPGDVLVFNIYDSDALKRDDLLGTASLTSEQFSPAGFDGELPLSHAGRDIQAYLKIRIQHQRPSVSAAMAAPAPAATIGSNGGLVRRFSSGPDLLATSRSRLITAPSPTSSETSQKLVGGYAVPQRRRVRSHGATARVSFDDSVVTKQTSSESAPGIMLDKADWEAQKDAEIAEAVDVERRRASLVEAEKNAEIEELRRQLAAAEMRTQEPPAHAQQDRDKAQESASTNNHPDRRSKKSFIRLHLGKIVGGAGVAHEVSLSDDGTRCKLETSQERKKISAELFKALDTTGTSLLGAHELLPLAELIGFDGTEEDWVKEYDILSQRYGWDPQTGASKEQFMRMIDDESSSAHLTDFELRLLLAELESHHEAHGSPRSRASSAHSSCMAGHARKSRKSVYETGHPHRRKSMVAKADGTWQSGYSNEY